jgi:hypothetical protein
MLNRHRYFTSFFASVGLIAGCSGGGAPPVKDVGGGAPQVPEPDRADEGGAAGAPEMTGLEGGAGAAGNPGLCSAATDCDDGRSCNGDELCVAGRCEAGIARQCQVGMECTEGHPSTCIFTDHSPWIVYEADDDTPGVPEAYAVKRGLLGKMQPLKLNGPLEKGWAASGPGTWSPDHQVYSFRVTKREPYEVALQVVRFGDGLPEAAVQLPGEGGHWSSSSKLLAITGPLGLTIYALTEAGQLELAYRDGDEGREQSYGWWAEDDAFVFAAQRKSDELWDIWRSYFDGAAWRTGLVVQDLDLIGFALSPTLKEVVYATRGHEPSQQYLFAHDLKRINYPIKLAGPRWGALDWSRDGQNYLLSLDAQANGASPPETQVFLGIGNATDLKQRQIAHGSDLRSASFTPNGKGFVLRRDDPEWGQRLAVYDIATGMGSSLGHLVAPTDDVRWSPDGERFAMPNHTSQTSDVELTLLGVAPSRDTLRIDSIPPNLQYYNLQFSSGGDFFAYYKGDDASRDYDAAYVDLRYPTVVDPEPVRLPGEGKMWTMNFDPDGSALYYIRERSNGARDCFFLDLSQQVAKDPVRINRAGRVDHCYAQKLSD